MSYRLKCKVMFRQEFNSKTGLCECVCYSHMIVWCVYSACGTAIITIIAILYSIFIAVKSWLSSVSVYSRVRKTLWHACPYKECLHSAASSTVECRPPYTLQQRWDERWTREEGQRGETLLFPSCNMIGSHWNACVQACVGYSTMTDRTELKIEHIYPCVFRTVANT